jgi:hypothetical protein
MEPRLHHTDMFSPEMDYRIVDDAEGPLAPYLVTVDGLLAKPGRPPVTVRARCPRGRRRRRERPSRDWPTSPRPVAATEYVCVAGL